MSQPKTAVGKTIRTNHDKENPYFMVARATAQDKRISYEALGVLTYLLSQSDQWEVRVGELAQRGKGEKKQGLTRIYRILKELRAAGYVVLEAEYVKGKIVNWTYQVHERPIDLLNQNLQVEKLNVENDSPNKDKEVPESTKKNSTPNSGVPNSPPVDTKPVATKTTKPNPWYDAILSVWGYNGTINGSMLKMLQGRATAAAWKDGNLPPENALTDPAQLLTWAAWYRVVKLGSNPKLNMLEERQKIQSSIIEWQALGCPDVDTPVQNIELSPFPIPDDVFDVWMHTNGSGELSEAKFAHRRAGGVWDDAAETAWLRAYKAERGMK